MGNNPILYLKYLFRPLSPLINKLIESICCRYCGKQTLEPHLFDFYYPNFIDSIGFLLHNELNYPTGSYLFKVRMKKIRATSEICSKLTIKPSNDVNDNILVSLLLTLNRTHPFFWSFHVLCCC